jgi:hypothetical protein
MKTFVDTFCRSIRFALALAAVTSNAFAADATVGGVSIKLPPPTGFCDLTNTDPSDKRMLTVLTDLVAKSGNKLLSMSADCRQLIDWRARKRSLLDDYGQYQASMALMDKPTAEPVKETCATLRAQGDKMVAEQAPDIKSRVESALEKVKINEMRFVGVLAESTAACYGGLIQKLRTEAGTDKTQLTVFAATIVKNKSIFVYRMAVYATSDTVTRTLAKIRTDVAALLAANKN